MIIDILCDLAFETWADKKEWIREVRGWKDNRNRWIVPTAEKIYNTLIADEFDIQAFKDACLDYMEDNGYRDSSVWNKFFFMPCKEIENKFNKKK